MLQVLTAVSVFAASLTTPEAAVIRATVDQAHEQWGETLVVFDLDNTILATDTHLGSEHWFLWQANQIAAGQADVAPTVDKLLRVQGWIYDVAPMHATDPRLSDDLKSYAARGIKAMALTSRNLDVRDATLRELARNGLDLTVTAPGPVGGYAGAYWPLGVDNPKQVIFERGVLMTQGQNKGSMLKSILQKTAYKPRAIIFVDDRQHHLDNVQAAFADRPEQVTTIRFTHEVPRVEAFNASDKQVEKAQWCSFARGLAAVVQENQPFILCDSDRQVP